MFLQPTASRVCKQSLLVLGSLSLTMYRGADASDMHCMSCQSHFKLCDWQGELKVGCHAYQNHCKTFSGLTRLFSRLLLYACPCKMPPGATSVMALNLRLVLNSRLSTTESPQSDAPTTTTWVLMGRLSGMLVLNAWRACCGCLWGSERSKWRGGICLQEVISTHACKCQLMAATCGIETM